MVDRTKSKRIQQLPSQDRPREKMLYKGVPALSDFELLEVCVGSGTGGADVGYISHQIQKLLDKYGSDALTYEHLTKIKGVSLVIAGKLMAAFELARRHLLRDSTPLRGQQDILARVSDIRAKRQEYFVVLNLDGGDRLINLKTVAMGTIDAVIAHPREIFADAVADRAASIVVVHNHPSGDPHPSQKDIDLSQQMAAAGQLLGIAVSDHIIVTKSDHYSFRQHRLL